MPSESHQVIISELINQICNFVQVYLIQFSSDADSWVPGITPGLLSGFSAKYIHYEKLRYGTLRSWKAFGSCQLKTLHELTLAGLGRSQIHSTAFTWGSACPYPVARHQLG